jgi:cytoskeletal protein RodZ
LRPSNSTQASRVSCTKNAACWHQKTQVIPAASGTRAVTLRIRHQLYQQIQTPRDKAPLYSASSQQSTLEATWQPTSSNTEHLTTVCEKATSETMKQTPNPHWTKQMSPFAADIVIDRSERRVSLIRSIVKDIHDSKLSTAGYGSATRKTHNDQKVITKQPLHWKEYRLNHRVGFTYVHLV